MNNFLSKPERILEFICPTPFGVRPHFPKTYRLFKGSWNKQTPLAKYQRQTTLNTSGDAEWLLLSRRISGLPEVQDVKLITPVRRSARIERAVSRYPEMLQEHDVVVASLKELLEVEETECFIFRKNEALPVTLGFKSLES